MARRPDPNSCPQCGARVSPYAAGCSACGTDLDPRRHDAPPQNRLRALLPFAHVERGAVIAVAIVLGLCAVFALANRAEDRRAERGVSTPSLVTTPVPAAQPH